MSVIYAILFHNLIDITNIQIPVLYVTLLSHYIYTTFEALMLVNGCLIKSIMSIIIIL